MSSQQGFALLWKLVCCLLLARSTQGLTGFVNTRIGTGQSEGEKGNCYPATGVPFGHTHLTPQTQPGETKCVAPFYIWDRYISGFRASHFLSGSCVQDYGSVTLMPLTELPSNGTTEESYQSAFQRENEESLPHRYSVKLDRYNITVQMSGTSHCGAALMQYPAGSRKIVVVKPNNDQGQGWVQLTQDHTVLTYNPVNRIYAGQGQQAGFAGHSVVSILNGQVKASGSFQTGHLVPGAVNASGIGGALWLELDTPDDTVELTICSSFTSASNARANGEAELGACVQERACFGSVASAAEQQWEAMLSQVTIRADQQYSTMFYTAFYHAALHPRETGDVSGEHPRFDGHNNSVPLFANMSGGGKYFDDFSMWDTFRGQLPWLSLVAPQLVGELASSLLAKAHEGGWLPIFPLWSSYTNEMVGDHSSVFLADVAAKGLFKPNCSMGPEAALKFALKNALQVPSLAEFADGKGRRALEAYLTHGFVPVDADTGKNQQVSISVEYAYDDFVLGHFALSLGDLENSALLLNRSKSYRNVFDQRVGYVRGKYSNGSWVHEFDPFAGGPGDKSGRPSWMTEASPAQYTFVPHDVRGLASLMGGQTGLVDTLDNFFANGHYEAGNEPDLHVPYLYAYGGEPWKTQYWVANLTLEHYSTDENSGLPGNDDAGAMSAWLLFRTLGFYPVCHGSGVYMMSAPGVPAVNLTVAGGSFRLLAPAVSRHNVYIQAVHWNGVAYHRSYVTHQMLREGGVLQFEMGQEPNTSWDLELPPQC